MKSTWLASHGADAAGDNGPEPRCWDAVVTDAMTRMFKAQAFRVHLVLSALASSAYVIEAGHRWK